MELKAKYSEEVILKAKLSEEGKAVAEEFQDVIRGPKGDPGEDGAPFTYDMFTPEQLAGLKGPKGDPGEKGESIKGDPGEKGEPFRYSDFTPEQLEALKGPKGDKGDQGQSIKGDKGDPFTYSDFTPAQLEGLKGPKGDKGDPGQSIKGDKGDPGEQGPAGHDYVITEADYKKIAEMVPTEGMTYYIITFDGTAFTHDDAVLTFAQIKTLCLDTSHFVYAQYSNRLYIPQYVSNNNIFFQATYITSDHPEIHRISINNLNQVSQYNYTLAKSTEIPTVPTAEISANTAARHSHSNKSVIDGITSAKVTAWDNKAEAADIPTDDHINELINTALGVIENGSY